MVTRSKFNQFFGARKDSKLLRATFADFFLANLRSRRSQDSCSCVQLNYCKITMDIDG